MSDDRGWYPGAGNGERGGGDGRSRDGSPRDPRRQGPSADDGRRPVPYRVDRPGDPSGPPPQYPAQPPGPRRRGVPDPNERDERGGERGGERGAPWSPYDPPSSDRRDPYGAPSRPAAPPSPRRDPRGAELRGAEPRGAEPWSPPGTSVPSQGGGRRAGRPAPEEDRWSPDDEPDAPISASVPGSRRPPSEGGRRGDRSAGSAAALDGNINEDLDLDELGVAEGGARGPGGRGPNGRKSRKRQIIKWTSIGVTSVLVIVLGLAAYYIKEFSGNIQHAALTQSGESQAPEAVNKFGESAMNILIIGSDTRDTAADCDLGGACTKGGANTGANADVEMVVHLSADRTNATVMSIPRDTITNLPACTDPTTGQHTGGGEGQINSTLQWGPSCTADAVHTLTGLTIDHFMMVDFSGVVTMSDALGGVPVCVSASMYDPDSGLRLSKGTTVIKGQQALEFLRTRHGFYDGSDLGREKAQHYFLSAMIREVRQNLNLTDIPTLISIANAATKALTVDDGLSGVTSLVDLAETLNKVPTSKITFVTMPWEYDPANNARVITLQPEANQMFQNIQNDVSYTAIAASAKASASPTTAPVVIPSPTVSVDNSTVHVQVENGGGVAGRAAAINTALQTAGFTQSTDAGNAAATATTTLYYPSSRSDSAAAVAHALGIPTTHMQESSAYSEVTVVIGSDWASGTTLSAASSSPTTAATAPADSSEELASTTGGCVTVSAVDTVK